VFKTISPNYIRLVDSHDNTINLIRANTTISTKVMEGLKLGYIGDGAGH